MSFIIKSCDAHLSYNSKPPHTFLSCSSKWFTNTNFRGSYSFWSLETQKRQTSPEELARPILAGSKKLLFAGEATHSCYYSSVHGALETGQREANRIIDMYK